MSTIDEGTRRAGFGDAGAPPRRGKLYWAVADGLVLAKRKLVKIPRDPELLVFSILQPVLFVLLFHYVFVGAIGTGGTAYVDFLMPGIFVSALAFGFVLTSLVLAGGI